MDPDERKAPGADEPEDGPEMFEWISRTDDAPAGPASAPIADEPRPATGLTPERRRGVVIGLVALLAVIAIVVVAVSGGDGESDGDLTAGDGQVTLVPARATTVVDGVSWRAVKGSWNVSRNRTMVASPGALGFSMLVRDGGGSSTRLEVTMAQVVEGAGLVFGYRSPFDYWTLQRGGDADWQVVKVEGGKGEVVRAIDGPTSPGTTLAVAGTPDGGLAVSFDGKAAVTVRDAAIADRTLVGLIAAGPKAHTAVFGRLEVSDVSAE